jgi:transglutaminase-like putative cysteine protease
MTLTDLPLRKRIQLAKPDNLWLLAGLTFGLIPHFIRLPLLIMLPSLILLGWRLLFELHYFPLPSRWLRWTLTLIAISATYASFHSLVGRQAGVGLLVVMLCLKLMEMNTYRDVGVVIGLGFFVIITVFLFNQSIFTGVYMLFVVVLLTTTLSAFSREFSSASQWLNIRHAGVIIAQALPLTLLLFVLFPRIPGPLWNLPSDSSGASTGLSDSMSPGNISRLSDNDAVAFRVQFEDRLPSPEKRYWRGPVLTRFDGKTWSNPQPSTALLKTELRYQASGDAVHYSVTLEPTQQRWLFALDLPAELPPDTVLSPDYELLARLPVQQLVRYPMTSYPDFQLSADRVPNPVRYLQLPPDYAPRTRLLARQFRNTAADDAGVVMLALRYIREQPFYYSRQPPLLPDDPVDEFLFDSRRGFCEHYASAFVFLMRAAGIPARVVTGYQGGEMNPQSDYYIVRQSDAHAWAEVWLPQQGWQRVDPTAAIPAERIEDQQDLARLLPGLARIGEAPGWAKAAWRQLRFGWDRVNHAWNQWVINYNDRRQRAFLTRLFSGFGLGEIDWREMVGLLATGMGVVLLGIALHTLRPWHPSQRDPVITAYDRFCQRLARRGIRRGPAEGPLDFSLRARQLRPELGPAIARITALYLRLRYAAPAKANQSRQRQLRDLQSAVRQFKA